MTIDETRQPLRFSGPSFASVIYLDEEGKIVKVLSGTSIYNMKETTSTYEKTLEKILSLSILDFLEVFSSLKTGSKEKFFAKSLLASRYEEYPKPLKDLILLHLEMDKK